MDVPYTPFGYQKRVQEEYIDLHDKLTKLTAFLDEAVEKPDNVQANLLHLQMHCMAAYLSVLTMRLNHWELLPILD